MLNHVDGNSTTVVEGWVHAEKLFVLGLSISGLDIVVTEESLGRATEHHGGAPNTNSLNETHGHVVEAKLVLGGSISLPVLLVHIVHDLKWSYSKGGSLKEVSDGPESLNKADNVALPGVSTVLVVEEVLSGVSSEISVLDGTLSNLDASPGGSEHSSEYANQATSISQEDWE